MVSIDFEWDPIKADSNVKIHGVSFDTAKIVFGDQFALTLADPLHSHSEDRFVTIGTASNGELLVLVHTERKSAIRIISARKATPSERRRYEENRRR